MSETEGASAQDRDFFVTSMFGYHTQQPRVSVKLHDIAVQVTPAKAREMATMLLEAAEAAEGDGFIVTWLQSRVGLEEKQATVLLQEFREWRQDYQEKINESES